MLIEERHRQILDIVEERKSVTIQELIDKLNISESTARRDLTVLDAHGQLIKVHGGATALGMNYYTKDDDVSYRQDLNRDEKREIVEYAATLIRSNDFVYLDAGTTTEMLIDYIKEKNAVFVTNGTVHAKKLAQNGCRTYILGGELKVATEAVVGAEAVAGLEKYNFTKGFFGTNGISLEKGFTTPDVSEAMVKRVAMRQCDDCYVLSDSSKFNHISSVTFADFEKAKIITTSIKNEQYKKCKNILEVNKK